MGKSQTIGLLLASRAMRLVRPVLERKQSADREASHQNDFLGKKRKDRGNFLRNNRHGPGDPRRDQRFVSRPERTSDPAAGSSVALKNFEKRRFPRTVGAV